MRLIIRRRVKLRVKRLKPLLIRGYSIHIYLLRLESLYYKCCRAVKILTFNCTQFQIIVYIYFMIYKKNKEINL